MPRKSIQKSQPKDFEPKRKNPISLGRDSNIDNDLKGLNINNVPVGIELSKDVVRFTKDITTCKATVEELVITKLKGNKLGSTTVPSFLFQNPNPAYEDAGLWFNIMTSGLSIMQSAGSSIADMVIKSERNLYLYTGETDGDLFVIRRGSEWISGYSNALIFDTYNTDLEIRDRTNESDYFKIDVGLEGATTISTVDADTAVAHLILDVDGDITLDAYGKQIYFAFNGTTLGHIDLNEAQFRLLHSSNTSDYFDISVSAEGATTISTVDADTAVGHLTLDPDGDLNFSGCDVNIDATKKFYLDSGGDTYIVEGSADDVHFQVGGDRMLQLTEGGTSGNVAWFRNSCAGFTRAEATFSTTGIVGSGGTDDTDIDFRHTNKYRLELTGDITTINLIFPDVSGNFVLTCRMNGDHDVANWKVFKGGNFSATVTDVMWAGGSVPAFTEGAPVATDIVSFYWDASEGEAYGVASLAFATP